MASPLVPYFVPRGPLNPARHAAALELRRYALAAIAAGGPQSYHHVPCEICNDDRREPCEQCAADREWSRWNERNCAEGCD